MPLPQPTRLLTDAEGHFDAYPCAARLGNGDLLVVFARCDHAVPAAAIWGVRSTDDGQTWGEPFPLIDTPGKLDYDPSLVAWDNKVLAIATTVPLTHGKQVTTSEFIAVRSEDYGRTWGAPFAIPFPYVYCSGKINPGMRFADGTLAFGFSPDMRLQGGGVVHSDGDIWGVSGVMLSTDDGHTWTPGETVGVTAEKAADAAPGVINGLDEPTLAVGHDGSLYMLMRSGFDRLYDARSRDQGRTWSAPRRTTLMAHNCPADVCVFDHPRLGRGWLVIYDHSPHHRYPLAVAVSFDEGETWSQPLILTGLGENPCYPACVQTAAGPVLLVWQRDLPGRRELQHCLLGLDEIEHLVD